jgi:secreted Zn-dependent insulinase-like peptidase
MYFANVFYVFTISSPHSYSTPVDSGLMHLLYATLEDRLRPLIGLVRAVGSTISLTDRVFGLQVQVSGFSDGIDRVLHKIMTTIATSSESISNESFYSQKEIYRQRILGWQRRQPCSLTESDILLKDPYWTPTQLYAALDGKYGRVFHLLN